MSDIFEKLIDRASTHYGSTSTLMADAAELIANQENTIDQLTQTNKELTEELAMEERVSGYKSRAIEELEAKVKELEEKLALDNHSILEARARIRELEEKLESAENTISVKTTALESAWNESNELEAEVKALKADHKRENRAKEGGKKF